MTAVSSPDQPPGQIARERPGCLPEPFPKATRPHVIIPNLMVRAAAASQPTATPSRAVMP